MTYVATYQYHTGMYFQKGYTPWNKGKPVGYWRDKKRPDMAGENNPRFVKKVSVTCKMCNKYEQVTERRSNRYVYCSHSCRARYNFTKERNPRWQGGVSNWKDAIRSTPAYVEWRLKVFQRDLFTCRSCGHRSKKSKAHGDKTSDIHAHHIIPMRSMKDDKTKWFEISNGITLCVPCHRKTYGKEELFAMEFKEILNDYTTDIPKG